MKTEFLAGFGLEQDTIDKIMAENGKDVEKQKKLTEAAQSKLDNLTAERDASNTTISEMTAKMEEMQKSGADAEGLKTQLNEALAQAAQSKVDAEKAQQDAADKITAMEYENAASIYINALPFSSEYAKKGFAEDFKAKGFKLEDGKFLGADDYVKLVQEKDPATFSVVDGSGQPLPIGMQILQPEGSGAGGGEKNPWMKEHYSLAEQTRIYRESPDKARAMAKAAGKNL